MVMILIQTTSTGTMLDKFINNAINDINSKMH